MFFVWTAPSSAGWQIDTEGSSGATDTKLFVHLGSDCTAACLNGDLDGGAMPPLSSKLVLPLTAGDTILIQVGSEGGTPVGAGLLNITPVIVPTNDSCDTPMPISGLGVFPFTGRNASASGFPGNPACGFDFAEDIFFLWTVPADGNYEVYVPPATAWVRGFAGPGCSAPCTGETWYPGGSNGRYLRLVGRTAGEEVMIQLGLGIAGWFEIRPWICDSYPPDSFEDNDTVSTAVPLVAGSYPNLSVGDFDLDFYEVTMQPNDVFVLTFQETGFTPADIDLNLYDGVGNFVEFWDSSGIYLFNNTGQVQTHILELFMNPDWGDQCTSYDMDVALYPHPCSLLGVDALEDNDSVATATPLVPGTITGLNAWAHQDLDLFSFPVAAGESITVTAIHDPLGCSEPDIDLFLYDLANTFPNTNPSSDPAGGGATAEACTCGADETLTWLNDTGQDTTCVLRVSVWPDAPWPGCAEYDLVFSTVPAGSDLSPFCVPALPNSTGQPVTLAGSSISLAQVVNLHAIGGPAGQPGIFIASQTSVDPGVPVSSGLLCLGAPIARYGPNAGGLMNSLGAFNLFGVLENLSGTSASGLGFDVPLALPDPPGGSIQSGETWHFQLWYRDGATSNISDGIRRTF